MNDKFFSFLDPFLEWLDSGKFFRSPFKWLYAVFAALNLLSPFYVLFQVINTGVLSHAPSKFIFVIIVAWLILTFASWLGFQLWWNRKDKVIATSTEDDSFVATLVFSHFIQTMGEWAGLMTAVVGFTVSLLVTLVLGQEGQELGSIMGVGGLIGSGLAFVILMPIYGFLMIVVSRFFAELCKALAAIANNTRKQAKDVSETND